MEQVSLLRPHRNCGSVLLLFIFLGENHNVGIIDDLHLLLQSAIIYMLIQIMVSFFQS